MSTTESFDVADFQRVKHLAELDLDYQELQAEFEDLTRLAASITGTEISLLNLIDSHVQWSVSGTETFEPMPREDSVCNYTLEEAQFFEVPRLDQDPRFQNRDYVAGDDGLRYYFGIPLKVKSDIPIGALCVMSSKPKSLGEDQIEKLKIIAGEIVNRLELKLELRKIERKVIKEEQTKQRLAHDVRGPIGGIVQLLDIANSVDIQSDELKEILSLAKKSGENILLLTEEILNQALDEKNQSENSFTLSSFVKKLQSLYTPQARSKDINFSVKVKEKVPTKFSKMDLLPVVGNLISNAIKFTPHEGKVSVLITIKETTSLHQELVIKVEDTGRGMSKDKLKEITSGTANSESGTNGEKGHGFGLRLVMELVDELDGRLEASSKPRKGTVVTVRLPLITA